MSSREDEDQALQQWCAKLIAALEVHGLKVRGLEVDIKSVLSLAGRAAHSVLRPAAPLTTYVVGYAAGFAAASGNVTGAGATQTATNVALGLCRDETPRDEAGGAR